MITFVVYVTVLFVSISLCGTLTMEELVKVEKNFEASATFKCDKPQLRAFKARKLLAEKMNPLEIASPAFGVLNRCDENTGCCTSEEFICMAEISEHVILYFMIQDPVNSMNRIEKYEGEWHTKCTCVKTEDDIK